MNKKGFGDIMKQAQLMQQKLAKLQEEAAQKTVEASAGGGMVTVVANGRQEILSMRIDPEVLKANDQEMLQDLIVAAVNEALRKARDLVMEDMKAISGGLDLSGLL